jgi:hypothetical protein
VDAVAEAFESVYGLPSWRVERGVGSFLTLDFGTPRVRIDDAGTYTPASDRRIHG